MALSGVGPSIISDRSIVKTPENGLIFVFSFWSFVILNYTYNYLIFSILYLEYTFLVFFLIFFVGISKKAVSLLHEMSTKYQNLLKSNIMKKTNFFARLFSKRNNDTTNNNTNNNNNVISVFSFTEIGTIQQWELCKNVVSSINSRNNEENNGTCVYSVSDVEKAKALLSTFRKEHKTDNDRFLCVRNQMKAKTDTATAVAKTATAHTASVQADIKGHARGSLNYAIKKYKSAQIVTIGEIKSAFEALPETDIYRYYSISTMQFNAKALLAKCVTNAINAKVNAAKQQSN